MKHIRTYEASNIRLIKPNFKVGDTVVCIDPTDVLKFHHKYTISGIEEDEFGAWYCKVAEYDDGFFDFYCYRFKLDIEFNTEKYNI